MPLITLITNIIRVALSKNTNDKIIDREDKEEVNSLLTHSSSKKNKSLKKPKRRQTTPLSQKPHSLSDVPQVCPKIPYRQTEGVARNPLSFLKIKVPNFRTLRYRFKKEKINLQNLPKGERPATGLCYSA